MAPKRKNTGPSTSYTYQTVQRKLNQVCELEFLRLELQRTAKVLQQVRLLGWKIAGLHVLRCLDDRTAPLDLSYHFFYRCCSAALAQTSARHAATSTPAYPDLHPTFMSYYELCSAITTYEAPSLEWCSAMITAMATQMETNTMNMLALNFRRRLRQYIGFKYAKKGKLRLGYKAAKKLVDGCYRVREETVVDSRGNATGTRKLWPEWDDPRSPAERELREWLGEVPWKRAIRQNPAYFIVKVYDMLTFMEGFAAEHPKTRGAGLYSMLPFSSSFVPGHITINISSLFELFSRIRNNPGVEQFVAEQLQVSCRKDRNLWTEHRDIIFRKLFNLDGLESSTREFAYEITTNGYAACVLLRREAQELDGDESVVDANPLTATKKRKTNDGLSVASVKTDPIDIALAKLPPGYEPDVMIGIDPGVKNVCTAACVGWLPGRRQRRRRNRRLKRSRSSKRRRKRNSNKQPGKHGGATGNFKGNGKPRRKRKPKNRHGQRIVAITTAEYYHLAMFDKQRSWNINLKKREPWYAAETAAMPSFKTADLEEYVERLKYFLAHLSFLVAFSSEESFRKWRFLTKSKKMTVTATLAKRLVPRPSAQVCIAFGDWSCQDGLRGNRRAPVKALKKALERRATVLPMDEFRTSKLCSDCNEILDKAVLLTKVKDRDTHEIKVVLKKNRNVFHCANSRYRANFWNRDVNAVRNILDLLRCKLLGLGRLAAFERYRSERNKWSRRPLRGLRCTRRGWAHGPRIGIS